MKTFALRLISAILFVLLNSPIALAWNHSIELGYGYSHDPNHTKYHNSGVLLSGDILPLYRNCWSFWSITGSLGQWHTTTPVNKNFTSGATSLALRLYPFNISPGYPFYILASGGPAYLTKRRFGYNTQASRWTFQSNIGLGAELKKWDLNLRFAHFSNANLGKPNDGFNVLYLLSLGYLF